MNLFLMGGIEDLLKNLSTVGICLYFPLVGEFPEAKNSVFSITHIVGIQQHV